MHRRRVITWLVMALALTVLASPRASADDGSPRRWYDDIQLGGWFGPRLFSDDSYLGYIDGAPAHPMLESAMAFGARASRPLFYPWLFPELELSFAPVSTDAVGGADSVSVLWLDPRAQVRFDVAAHKNQLFPFAVVGFGAPISLSSARKTYESSIIPEGYFGGGLRFDTRKGFIMRFDARIALIPGAESSVTTEVDIGIGLEFGVGKQSRPVLHEIPPDNDNDGIANDHDVCVTRAEDRDGFEDTDGCPDIDNDLDRVLDIADACPGEPEAYNGMDDDDGCPDTVPGAVDLVLGTIEGLTYGEGETAVRRGADRHIKKIAKVMLAHPTLKLVAAGHTDDREARQFASTKKDDPPPDLPTLSADLSRARAQERRCRRATHHHRGPRRDRAGFR
jgi:hypothetical protein